MIQPGIFDAISALAILIMLGVEIAQKERYRLLDAVIVFAGLAFTMSALSSESKMLFQAFIRLCIFFGM